MSLDMSGWAALGETTAAAAPDGQSADAACCNGDASHLKDTGLQEGTADARPRAESQLGSIAAWQAIAADVSTANLTNSLQNLKARQTLYRPTS